MRFTVALLILSVAASAQPNLTDEQMDMFVKPCVVDNVNCPPGKAISYETVKEDLPMMKLALQMQKADLPGECVAGCGVSDERCNRLCYYAIMKQAIRMNREKGRRRKRSGHRRH